MTTPQQCLPDETKAASLCDSIMKGKSEDKEKRKEKKKDLQMVGRCRQYGLSALWQRSVSYHSWLQSQPRHVKYHPINIKTNSLEFVLTEAIWGIGLWNCSHCKTADQNFWQPISQKHDSKISQQQPICGWNRAESMRHPLGFTKKFKSHQVTFRTTTNKAPTLCSFPFKSTSTTTSSLMILCNVRPSIEIGDIFRHCMPLHCLQVWRAQVRKRLCLPERGSWTRARLRRSCTNCRRIFSEPYIFISGYLICYAGWDWTECAHSCISITDHITVPQTVPLLIFTQSIQNNGPFLDSFFFHWPLIGCNYSSTKQMSVVRLPWRLDQGTQQCGSFAGLHLYW